MPTKIELLKIRDFGEIITDTFVFVRENFKPLFKSFFVFSGIFLFVGALLLALQQARMANGLSSIRFGPSQTTFGQNDPFAIFTLNYFLGLFFMLFGYISLQITIFSFIALYKQKENNPPSIEEVWGYFKYFFWRVIGSGILIGILILIASLFCLVPGIYLYPILSLVVPIMVYENASFGYAFNKSFKLIVNNWWLTFGAIIVMGLIVWVAALVVLIPISLANMANMFLHFSNGTSSGMVMSIITAVCQLVSHVLYILPIVTISLCYFNLSEQVDGAGLMARINQIGNIINEDSRPEEEH